MSRDRIPLEPVGMDGTPRCLHVGVRLAKATSILSPTGDDVAVGRRKCHFREHLWASRGCRRRDAGFAWLAET